MKTFYKNKGLFSRIIYRCAAVLICTLCIQASHAQATEFLLPSFIDGTHVYYHDLLQQSLEASGIDIEIKSTQSLPTIGHVPQKRAVSMLQNDQLSILWRMQSRERDKHYTPVEVGITNNLIGHRILLIPRGKQPVYDKINNLEDLRNAGLVGGFGINWFDARVWKKNKLKYQEVDGEWRHIYPMVASKNRGIDYFSRGFNEIMLEIKLRPDLEIEKRLMLIYDRDFRFYLSPSTAK